MNFPKKQFNLLSLSPQSAGQENYATGVRAVSYTHLDVYKRQVHIMLVLSHSDRFGIYCHQFGQRVHQPAAYGYGSTPVSYTHLICLNGAAARKVQVGDIVIIMSYAMMDFEEAKSLSLIHISSSMTNRGVFPSSNRKGTRSSVFW